VVNCEIDTGYPSGHKPKHEYYASKFEETESNSMGYKRLNDLMVGFEKRWKFAIEDQFKVDWLLMMETKVKGEGEPGDYI
jgi:hypothetical protein